MAKATEKLRTTLFLDKEVAAKLNHIVKMEYALSGKEITRTDIVNEVLADYVLKWEKKHGTITKK